MKNPNAQWATALESANAIRVKGAATRREIAALSQGEAEKRAAVILLNEKRGPCRVCGETFGVELAHLTGREHDPYKPGTQMRQIRYVRPESVIPLCGPATTSTTCHGLQHAGLLDLIPHTTFEEQACAVSDIGLYAAYVKLGAISREARVA